MRVSVNGENRELHVYDRSTGVDYAKQIVCSSEQLQTDMYGEFVLTEEEYKHWEDLLLIQQESEAKRYLKQIKPAVLQLQVLQRV